MTLNDDQILTIDEVAALLKATKAQVYEMVRTRYAKRHGFALRKFYVGRELRFRQSDVSEWVGKSVNANAERNGES